MNNTVILDENSLQRTVIRLSHEVVERNRQLQDVAFIGIRRGGEVVAQRVVKYIRQQTGVSLPCAGLDIAPFRDDDKAKKPLEPGHGGEEWSEKEFGFSVTGKTVVLCDDVLYTGRSVRAAIDGLFAFGRPQGIQLLVLVDRGGREVPVRADFVGKNVSMPKNEYVQVEFRELGGEQDRLYITKINQ